MANKLDNLKLFEKGQSGNPAGRPPGSKNRSTIARKWLETKEKKKNPITKEIEDLTQEDLMTLGLILAARKGNPAAYEKLMDTAYGKIVDKAQIETRNLNMTPEERQESIRHLLELANKMKIDKKSKK